MKREGRGGEGKGREGRGGEGRRHEGGVEKRGKWREKTRLSLCDITCPIK